MADVATVLAGLKGFQRDAVDHIIEQFYGSTEEQVSRRFLVADETGLGKSIIARGVIARTIELLEQDERVDRIDIVYICSNQDLATQNLRRLNVTNERDLPFASRLTLLATELPRLTARSTSGSKKVNLISFTPATSGMTGGGWRTGRWEERALLAILLKADVTHSDDDWRALVDLLKWTKGEASFRTGVSDMLARLGGSADPTIHSAFRAQLDGTDLVDKVRRMITDRLAGTEVHGNQIASAVSQLRQALAKASVSALQPDLVILDEFQKFRDLLADPESNEAAELADAMFRHETARVLLLSATPYSPFTRADDATDDHYRDFMETIEFLADRDKDRIGKVRTSLEKYRAMLIGGGNAKAAADQVRASLLPYMTRSERPHVDHGFAVRQLDVRMPSSDDVIEFATLRAFGDEIGAPIDIEYWKSIPYFANFMDGYKPGERAREKFATPEGAAAEAILSGARSIDLDDVERFAPVDPGNGYLRALAAETVQQGWWRLLWMPPSMPYLVPGKIYAPLSGVTKRLVFSAWSGVPTSVAALLSYEADHTVAAHSGGFLSTNTSEARERISQRFTYRIRAGEVGALSTLALFWPHPELARRGDQLTVAKRHRRAVTQEEAQRTVGESLAAEQSELPVWDAFFSVPGSCPVGEDHRRLINAAMGDDVAEDAASDTPDSGLIRHADAAMKRAADLTEVSHRDLPRLALYAPGTSAYRALQRIAGPSVTETGLWRAAFLLADGLRRLFDRVESVATLVGIYGEDRIQQPYWSSVLSYCADGNLQAVLDEYLYQLRSDLGGAQVDDATLMHLARHTSEVLRIRPARYQAHDTTRERKTIPFQARFALRYGARFGDAADVRDSQVRAAFNSPFAPFVLVSTSVGQEGIDFHWWCHSVVHWNLPRNPVDFEQREGRVNRFAGHAIRRNVAHHHWDEVLAASTNNPWAAAFDAAEASDVAKPYGEFAPWWVYPGPAQIQRVIAQYPLSRDIDRYTQLRDSLALYRLTLGQPRQEDMVDLLRKRGVDGASAPTIDLHPPQSPAT